MGIKIRISKRKECPKPECNYYNKGFHNHFRGRPPIFESLRKELYNKGELSTPVLYDRFKKQLTSKNSLANYLAKDPYITEVKKIKVERSSWYGSNEVTVWKHRFAGIEAIVA